MKTSRLRWYAFGYLVFLYLPVALLPIFAFNSGTVIAFPLQGFTVMWFVELTRIDALHGAFWNSLLVAISAAVLSTGLGLFAARASSRYRFPAKRGIMTFIMVPLVLPEIIVGVSLLVVIVNLLGLPLSLWAVVLGHTLLCTPFSIAILSSSFNGLDRSLEEAAMDLGSSAAGAFFNITLPLVMPGVVASLLISFTISLDEFIIAFFLTGAEPTMPVYIWSQLRFPQKVPVIMALGTILLLASILLVTIAELARRRGVRRSGGKDSGGFL